MTPFKKLAIAALAASVAVPALTAGSSAFADSGWAFGNGGANFMTMSGGGHGGKRGGRFRVQQMFDRLDTDGDQAITAEEVDAVRASHFSDADTDGNGEVNLEEFKAAFLDRSAGMQVRAFQFLDRNGDGEVNRDEFDQVTDRGFNRLDRNRDDVIERLRRGGDEEHGQGFGQRRGTSGDGDDDDRRAGRGDGRKGEGRGSRGDRGRGGPGNPMRALMTTFDTDGDGKVTRDEFVTVRAELFASADTDGSGSFAKDDFPAIWVRVNEQTIVRMFQREDADGSLGLSAEEHGGPLNGFMERHDRNGDGVVTQADFRSGKRGWFGRGDDGRERRGRSDRS